MRDSAYKNQRESPTFAGSTQAHDPPGHWVISTAPVTYFSSTMKTPANEIESTLDAEAARYALLMRLGPSLRHGLMGQIQILQFLAEMALRQSKSGRDASQVSEALGKMPSQVVVIRERCHALARWLRSDLDEIADVEAVVEEVRAMLDVEFSLRERQLIVQCALAEVHAPREPLIEVLAAALLALSDESRQGGVFKVEGAMNNGAVVFLISANLQQEDAVGPDAPYRKLDWNDVRALARGVGIDFSVSDNCARIAVQPAQKNSAAA
jgi:hypothetical protein